MKKLISLSLFFVLMISVQNKAFSWGKNGHRVVGEIAWNYMNLPTKIKYKKVMENESLAIASVWADLMRSVPEKISELEKMLSSKDQKISLSYLHFVGYPYGKTYETSEKEAKGDIIWGIQKLEGMYNKKLSQKVKKDIIRLLAHFVGDIHQPLHVGNGEDKGGNSCWVNFFGEKYIKNITPTPPIKTNYQNLHSVWDTSIIQRQELSYTELTKKILDMVPSIYSKKEVKSWEKDGVLTWAKESHDLHSKVYLTEKREYCFKDYTEMVKAENIPVFSWKELSDAEAIIHRRLFQGGVRLAKVLEKIL